MKTAIIILNYNDYKTTNDMINQIKDYECLDKIVIVDNCSLDDSYNKLKKYESDKIKVIKTDENKGYSYGNNYGIKYLIKNYKIDNIIISNPDIIVKEKDIKTLINDLNENSNISLIAPVIDEHGQISRGWKIPTYVDELLSNINYVHRIAKKRTLYDYKHYNTRFSKVDVVSGCFFLIKKDVFSDVDFFDEGTFLYYEENILASKLKKLGYESYIDNNVTIKHNVSISIDKNISSIKKYKILKNSQKYYQKKYNNIGLFKLLLLRVLYYISLLFAYIIYFINKLKNGLKN